jgi:hypothetical protein
MKKIYYLIDTSNWICAETSSVMSESDVAAKNAGYMHNNSSLRWYAREELERSSKSLPIVWEIKGK